MASHLRTTGCHTISLATRRKRAHAALTAASKAGTRFIYPGGMEGWVDPIALITLRPGIEARAMEPYRIAGLRKWWDPIRESKIFIKNKTKVACRMSGIEWRVVNFKNLLCKTNDEKFKIWNTYTLCSEKNTHSHSFCFISPWIIRGFKQKWQWICPRNGRF